MLNSVSETTRRRLSADDRRRQLVGIGLQMLTTQPIHQLSIDAVAEQAGISRGLLFHYFPTKRDTFVVEVYDETRAALTTRVLGTLGESAVAVDAASARRMTVHAWFAYVEDLALEWSALAEPRPLGAGDLVDLAIAALDALLGLAPRSERHPVRPTRS